ncbi:CoA transferase [Acinetobacter guerrae]|uniref:CoA transferase n=2 Tax=Gammaproteobacteria TaxID=1236 RepID=A0A3A8EFD9_9GAMM|nr:CaiB/BaiF CoA-transferase family protein [Acinetobacter guerrae]RKG33652.1 CoA transferase [Acinetobacter guerrae]
MNINTGALKGIKVLDLSRVLGGPFSAQVLADHGAEVIKVEPPQKDETRFWGPPFRQDSAAYFSGINRNKQGISIDLTQAEGRKILFKLLGDADVLIENFKIGTLEKWGLGFEEVLSKQFPRLIHCRVTGFGADGPLGGLPGYDSVIQAISGIMSVNGEADGEPLRVGLPVVDMVTGLNAVIGILLALQARQVSGQGQFVEAALFDTGVSLLHPHLPNYLWSGKVPERTGNAHPNITPYDAYQTKTSPIYIAVGNNQQFAKLCQHLDLAELMQDPRFADNAARCQNRKIFKQLLENRLAEFDGDRLAYDLIQTGVPCGPILNVAEIVQHPHTKHRKMVVEIGDEYQGIGSPIKLSQTPASYRQAPPAFAEHTVQVLQRKGFSDEQIELLIEQGIISQHVTSVPA